jgi:hypothetical protein
MLAATLALVLITLAPQDGGQTYRHPGPVFELQLPGPDWKTTDQSSGEALVLIFSPDAAFLTRCSVLRMPAEFLPNGLATRETQIQSAAGKHYVRVALEAGRIAERDATRWEYTIAGGTTIEWSFRESEDELAPHVIFQIAGPKTTWDDPAGRASLEAIAGSFRWTGGEAKTPVATPVATKDPDTLREQRAAGLTGLGTKPKVEVTRHRIAATIEPQSGSLRAIDRITLVAHEPEQTALTLYTTLVAVESVVAADDAIAVRHESTSLPNADALRLAFDSPLPVGEEVEIVVTTTATDFLQRIDQQLVAEIAIVGQVRERSSFSSHVLWYPMDERNDAAVEIAFDVPKPYVAVTGGRLTATEDAGERVIYRYVEEHRVLRQLPFGFAIGDYASAGGRSDAGLEVKVYGFKGEEARIEQRVATLLDAAAAFERALGPLPWPNVAFAHVTPIAKETGVSLPGLILVSDFYFPDLEGMDASKGNLEDPQVLGLLVVADELSHQWNFYAAGFPNELAEGISTYTNALFLERRHGDEAYRNAIAYCRKAWLAGAGRDREYAIADPAVYSSRRYRAVVFCKTPLVLDLLRRKLGDEKFFAGFRAAFAIDDRRIDGFERLERGFEEAAGIELRPFFDQWFFRAAFPRLELRHEAREGGITVVVQQLQDEAPYALEFEVEIELEDGTVLRHSVAIEDSLARVDVDVAGKVTAVRFAEPERLPWK